PHRAATEAPGPREPTPLAGPAGERSGVLLPHRDHGRPLSVPETVEGAQRVLRLVVRPTRERGQDHRRNPAQPELEPDLVRPQTIVAPVDERNRPGQVAAVELGAAALTDEAEPTKTPLPTA